MNDIENKIIVVAFTTLDGVVEDPDGSWGAPTGGWGLRQGPEAFTGDKFSLGPILDTGALLFGRRTWTLFAQRWPTRTGDFADAMNRTPKFVASRTLTSVDGWSGSVLLDDELTVVAGRLRTERDVVVVGSTTIARQLAAAALVDEYRLFVMPTAVGAGERLFDDDPPTELRLTAAEVRGPGALLRFDVVR